MIFITVGSQKFQFNRLLKMVDYLIEQNYIQEEIFAQIGVSDYLPKHFKYNRYLNRDEFQHYQDKADLVITHSGTGSIVGALKKRKKVIVVPRYQEFNEHVDNHQLEIAEEFKNRNLVTVCLKNDSLFDCINFSKSHEFYTYQSNRKRVISNIEKYITNNFKG